MTHFQTPKKLVSWVGLRPRNEESAGKIKARGITHGNRFVRKTMIECSWGAARIDKYIATAKPVKDGRVELIHYIKEQSISFEYHRYGSILEVPPVE